jgi:hypothetical protein
MWPLVIIGGAVLWLARVRRNPQLDFFQDVGFDPRWPELRASNRTVSGSFATGVGRTRLYHTNVYGYKATREWLLGKLGHKGGTPDIATAIALQTFEDRVYRDPETGETMVTADFSRVVDRQREQLDKSIAAAAEAARARGAK